MTRQGLCLSVLVAFLVGALAATASAQFPNPVAPANMMDEMSSGSTGPNPGAYIGRAQNAAAPAAPGFGRPTPTPTPAASGGGFSYNTYGAGGYGGYSAGGAAAAPGVPATPTPTPIPSATVVAGLRVVDAVTGELIDDAQYTEVPVTNVENNYFDDGTHGDEVAGDLVFSNIQERQNVIGASSHQVLMRMINSLQAANQMTPLEFYRLNVLTTEAISEIDQWRDKEAEMDKVLRQWSQRFVNQFKKDPQDVASGFYDLYVVSPPPKPPSTIPTPIGNWKPPTSPLLKLEAATATQGGGAAAGGPGGYSAYGY